MALSIMSLYDDVFSFRHLYESETRARKSKGHKKDVISFEEDLGTNLFDLYERLHNRTYRVEGYHHFKIYEPKERNIQSLRYCDRVVQHCLVDFYLGPLLERHLIYGNAACRKNKGTDFARNLLKRYLSDASGNGPVYILQFDIHHYFEEMNHEVLKKKLQKLVLDDEMYAFLSGLVDSYNQETGKGLPMGNQTSQCFALYYLDGLDRLIKEKYRIKGYVRYMDDGVVISNDKALLHSLLCDACKELSKLKLSFNEKKTHIFPFAQGVTFLGYRFKPESNGSIYLRLAKERKKRLIRHLIKTKKEISPTSLDSYLVHASKAKEYRLKRYIMSFKATCGE